MEGTRPTTCSRPQLSPRKCRLILGIFARLTIPADCADRGLWEATACECLDYRIGISIYLLALSRYFEHDGHSEVRVTESCLSLWMLMSTITNVPFAVAPNVGVSPTCFAVLADAKRYASASTVTA